MSPLRECRMVLFYIVHFRTLARTHTLLYKTVGADGQGVHDRCYVYQQLLAILMSAGIMGAMLESRP